MSHRTPACGLRRLMVLAAFSAGLTLGTPAHAQHETERGAAEALFNEARELMGQGRFAEACPKFASSYQLDAGLGTLLNLAACYKANGQIASAWSTFRESAMLARRNGEQAREAVARQEASALEQKVGKLRLLLDPQLTRTEGLEVRLDGSALPIAALTTPLPVDAGEHVVHVSAPGKHEWQGRIASRDAAIVSLRVPALTNAPSKKKPASASESNPGATQRITAIAVGGLGMVALGVAGFYALSAESTYSDSNSLCSKSGICTAHGMDLRDEAKSKGTTAAAFAGAGAVALASAGVLWFTAPSRESREGPPKPKTGRIEIRPHSAAWGLELRSVW